MDDYTDIQKVKALVRRLIAENERQRAEAASRTVSLAAIVPYDPTRRKTKDERRLRKKRREKADAARKRKEHNEKVVRSMNLKKE